MDYQLRAFAVRQLQTEDALEADVLVVEPDGAEHRVSCVVRGDQLEIFGNTMGVDSLHARYGKDAFAKVVRAAVLAP